MEVFFTHDTLLVGKQRIEVGFWNATFFLERRIHYMARCAVSAIGSYYNAAKVCGFVHTGHHDTRLDLGHPDDSHPGRELSGWDFGEQQLM